MEWKPRGGISGVIYILPTTQASSSIRTLCTKPCQDQDLPICFSVYSQIHCINMLSTKMSWEQTEMGRPSSPLGTLPLPWVLLQLQVMQSSRPLVSDTLVEPSINVGQTAAVPWTDATGFPHAMFHMFLISGNSNGIHSKLDMFSLGFFVVSALEDFNKIWIWLTHFCYWIKWDVCGECLDVTFSIRSPCNLPDRECSPEECRGWFVLKWLMKKILT